jgi:heptosyltransferase II
VLFQNAFESAFTAWLAGIPVRIGYPTDLRGPLLTLRVPLTTEIRQKHQVFYYLGITGFVAAGFARNGSHNAISPDCSVPLNGDHKDRAAELLASHGVDQSAPIFCLCPGSVNSEAKRWPGDYFAALADLLSERLGGNVVFLGAPGERGLVESIIEQTKTRNAANCAGEADILTSMAVMGLSTLVISNDTGSAHLAVAASADVLTLFGPTSAGATAPFGPRAHLLQGEAPCAPCRHFRCPSPEHRCMRSIRPEDVLKKAKEIVGAHPRSQAPPGNA